jgi:hypothetical protein
MELKVWVEGIQRIVCGVTENTTCQVGVLRCLATLLVVKKVLAARCYYDISRSSCGREVRMPLVFWLVAINKT